MIIHACGFDEVSADLPGAAEAQCASCDARAGRETGDSAVTVKDALAAIRYERKVAV